MNTVTNVEDTVWKPEIGKTYQLHHSRFGRATVKVVAINGEWIDCDIVSGRLVGMADSWGAGETKTVRASLCYSWTEVAK